MGSEYSLGQQASRPVSLFSALFALISSVRDNQFILSNIVRGEVASQYRNTILGFFWPMITPLLMIAVYTMVFGVIFKVRFGAAPGGADLPYGVILFSGLLLHSFFAETLMRVHSIVLENSNYVKRVIFPLELLPIGVVCSSLVHAFFATLVLLAVLLAVGHSFPATALMLPLLWLPVLVMLTGLALFIASLGVFIRDIGQIIGFVMTVMMFGSSILFPPEMLPEWLRVWVLFNPLTIPVDAMRDVLLWGQFPNWDRLWIYCGAATATFWVGAWWFLRTKRGFAEVM